MDSTQEQIDKLAYAYEKEKETEDLEKAQRIFRDQLMKEAAKSIIEKMEKIHKEEKSVFETGERKPLFNDTRYSKKIVAQDYFRRVVIVNPEEEPEITPALKPKELPALTTPEEKALIKDSKFLQKVHKLRSLQKSKREYVKLTRKEKNNEKL